MIVYQFNCHLSYLELILLVQNVIEQEFELSRI